MERSPGRIFSCNMMSSGFVHGQKLAWVFPLPVWPYAKQVAIPLSNMVSTSGRAVNLKHINRDQITFCFYYILYTYTHILIYILKHIHFNIVFYVYILLDISTVTLYSARPNKLFFFIFIYILIFVILYSVRLNKTNSFLSCLWFLVSLFLCKLINIWPVNHFVCRCVVESVIESKRLVLQVSG